LGLGVFYWDTEFAFCRGLWRQVVDGERVRWVLQEYRSEFGGHIGFFW